MSMQVSSTDTISTHSATLLPVLWHRCSHMMYPHIGRGNKKKNSAMAEMRKLFLILIFVHRQRHALNAATSAIFFLLSQWNSSSLVIQSIVWYICILRVPYRSTSIKCLLSNWTPGMLVLEGHHADTHTHTNILQWTILTWCIGMLSGIEPAIWYKTLSVILVPGNHSSWSSEIFHSSKCTSDLWMRQNICHTRSGHYSSSATEVTLTRTFILEQQCQSQ